MMQARGAYDKMRSDGVHPNARFFTEYLRICGRAGSMQVGGWVVFSTTANESVGRRLRRLSTAPRLPPSRRQRGRACVPWRACMCAGGRCGVA